MKKSKNFEKSGRLLVIATAMAGALAACNHGSGAPSSSTPSTPAQTAQAKKAAATPKVTLPNAIPVIPKTTPASQRMGNHPTIVEIKSFLTGNLVSKTETPSGLSVVTPKAAVTPPSTSSAKNTQAPQAVKPAVSVKSATVIKIVTKTGFPSLAEVKSFLTGDLVNKTEAPYGLRAVTKSAPPPLLPSPPGMKVVVQAAPKIEPATQEVSTLASGLKVAFDSKTDRGTVLNLGGCGLKLIRATKSDEDLAVYLRSAGIYVKTAGFLTTEPRHVFELYKHAFGRARIPQMDGGLGICREETADPVIQSRMNLYAAETAFVVMINLKNTLGEKRLAQMSFEDLDHDLDDPKILEEPKTAAEAGRVENPQPSRHGDISSPNHGPI